MGERITYPSVEETPELSVSSADTTYNKTGNWRVMRPEIKLEDCIGCFICWKFCPDTAINIVDEMPQINYEFCKGCGICAEECPRNCITFSQEKR